MAQSDIDQSFQVILDKLDNLLKNCTPLVVEDAHGMDYTAGLVEMKKVCSSYMEKFKHKLGEKACALVKVYTTTSPMDEPFRIFSIGCGDGSIDASIIQAIVDRFPDVPINYIGTDIDEQTCQKAAEALNVLKSQNVKIEILPADFEKIDSFKSRIPLCNLVLAIHVFYYTKNLSKVVCGAKEFLKYDGGMIIVLRTSQCPTVQLYKRFFEHERKWPMKFYDNVIEILNQMGIAYKTDMVSGELDLTECFRDGFQKSHQKSLLNFMTLAKMMHYPEAVTKVCIDYLASVCTYCGNSDRSVVPFSVPMIIV